MTAQQLIAQFLTANPRELLDDPGFNGLEGRGFIVESPTDETVTVMDVTEDELVLQVIDSDGQMVRMIQCVFEEIEITLPKGQTPPCPVWINEQLTEYYLRAGAEVR